MSQPRLQLRARSTIAVLSLVSVLHTSVTAQGQTRAVPPAAGAPARPAAKPSPATSPATSPAMVAAGTPGAGSTTSGAPTPPAATPSPGGASPRAGGPGAATTPGAPSPVDAGGTRERARAAYSAGQDAYSAGQYAAAEAHFGLADSLVPAVQAKYWRAMSLDQLGNVPAALAAFELVLSAPDTAQLGAEKLAHAEARRQALAATPAELVLTTTPPGARVNVSGVELRAATPVTLRLAPGRHLVRVTLDGYEPQQIELNVTPGAKLTPTLSLTPAANPNVSGAATIPALSAVPVDAPPASTPRSAVPGIVTLGIAGASAIVGTIFGIKALSDKSEFEDAPSTSKADDVERNALIADMAFGVTLTLGITGIVLLVADDPAADQPQVSSYAPFQPPPRLQISPYVATTGAGAAATLQF